MYHQNMPRVLLLVLTVVLAINTSTEARQERGRQLAALERVIRFANATSSGSGSGGGSSSGLPAPPPPPSPSPTSPPPSSSSPPSSPPPPSPSSPPPSSPPSPSPATIGVDVATTTNAQVTSTLSVTNEASLTTSVATTTTQATLTLSTTAVAGGAASTTTLSAATSASTSTTADASTTLSTATTEAAMAGPGALSTLSTTASSTTAATISSVVTTLIATTSVTSTTASTTALSTAAVTASAYVASSATSSSSMLPSNVLATATASVGFTTFSTATGTATTGAPQIPKSTCASGTRCCQTQPPVEGSQCLGTGYQLYSDLALSDDAISVAEPFTVEGSTLLSRSVMQISSPTIFHGDLNVDATSVLALTQVPGLQGPLLTVIGSSNFAGLVTVTLDAENQLMAPMILVTGDVSFSGDVVITPGKSISQSVSLLQASKITAVDTNDDGVAVQFVLVLDQRPEHNRKKRDQAASYEILCFNATQELNVSLESVITVTSPRYLGNECDDINANAQSNQRSLSLLVSLERKCNKNLAKGAIAGIVVGAVIFAAIIIIVLGVVAQKRGLYKSLFNAKTKEDGMYVT